MKRPFYKSTPLVHEIRILYALKVVRSPYILKGEFLLLLFFIILKPIHLTFVFETVFVPKKRRKDLIMVNQVPVFQWKQFKF